MHLLCFLYRLWMRKKSNNCTIDEILTLGASQHLGRFFCVPARNLAGAGLRFIRQAKNRLQLRRQLLHLILKLHLCLRKFIHCTSQGCSDRTGLVPTLFPSVWNLCVPQGLPMSLPLVLCPSQLWRPRACPRSYVRKFPQKC